MFLVKRISFFVSPQLNTLNGYYNSRLKKAAKQQNKVYIKQDGKLFKKLLTDPRRQGVCKNVNGTEMLNFFSSHLFGKIVHFCNFWDKNIVLDNDNFRGCLETLSKHSADVK